MHRIITKLLTIPASGPPALSIRFASIARSQESKMAVSDRGREFRDRGARTKTKEKKKKRKKKKTAYRRNKKTLFGGGERMRRKGWHVKIKRYLPARESRDAYIICISGIARVEQKWLRDWWRFRSYLPPLYRSRIADTEISKLDFNPVIYALVARWIAWKMAGPIFPPCVCVCVRELYRMPRQNWSL